MIMIVFNCDSEPGWFLRTEGHSCSPPDGASVWKGGFTSPCCPQQAEHSERLPPRWAADQRVSFAGWGVTVPMLHLYDLFHTQNTIQVFLILLKEVFWQPIFQCMFKIGNFMFNFGTLSDSMFKIFMSWKLQWWNTFPNFKLHCFKQFRPTQ